jgi:hypothetical protein
MTYRDDLPEWNPDRPSPPVDGEFQPDPNLREGRVGRLGMWVTGLFSAFIVFFVLYGLTRDPRPIVEQEVAKQSPPVPAEPMPATPRSTTTGQGPTPQPQGQ